VIVSETLRDERPGILAGDIFVRIAVVTAPVGTHRAAVSGYTFIGIVFDAIIGGKKFTLSEKFIITGAGVTGFLAV
jgi:hypothetical protein